MAIESAAALAVGFGILALSYTIAGYPILLGLIARRGKRPIHKQFLDASVSVIIPVHNGAGFLAAKLQSVLALDYPRDKMEIWVVSDGSTDDTANVARSFACQGVRLLEVPKAGKPAALNAAVPLASGDILILTDVRQALEPQSVRHLVNCFADPAVGAASGDLIIRGGNQEESNVGIYWRYERWIRKQLAAVDSMLGATGPFYALRRSLFVTLPTDCLLDDMYEPLAGAFRQGFRLVLDPEARAFDYPTNLDTEFSRKVRTLAGNYQILWQLPWLLSFTNRMLWHYFSLKIARLLLPWFFLWTFLWSFLLPTPFALLFLLPQACLLLLAFLDRLFSTSSPLKKLSSPARTVVSMLAAAAAATQIFFVPPQKLWKPTNLLLKPTPTPPLQR